MRELERIILHCSATKPGVKVSAERIKRWHIGRNFRTIGYHFVIQPNGLLEMGRPINEVGAHCKGFNKTSVGICYIGGLDAQGNACNTMTDEQVYTLAAICSAICYVSCKYVPLHGHREFNNTGKECPGFDVAQDLAWFIDYLSCTGYGTYEGD